MRSRGIIFAIERAPLGVGAQKKSKILAVGGIATIGRGMTTATDLLRLEVRDLEVMVLTGIYSEETHLPQPLRISIAVDLDCPDHFAADTPLRASKNYMDIKRAATAALPENVHFVLIEAVADHIAETLFVQDKRVRRVEVKIVKLAIAEAQEQIGITLVRYRK